MAGNDVCMYDPYQDISDEFGWHQSPGVPAEAQPEPEIDGVEEANMDVQDLEEEADPGNTLEDEVDWGDEEAADGAEAAEGGEGEEGREGGEGGEGGAETKLEATDPADSQQVPADSISLVEDDDECQIVSVDIIQPAPEPEVQKGKGKGKGKKGKFKSSGKGKGAGKAGKGAWDPPQPTGASVPEPLARTTSAGRSAPSGPSSAPQIAKAMVAKPKPKPQPKQPPQAKQPPRQMPKAPIVKAAPVPPQLVSLDMMLQEQVRRQLTSEPGKRASMRRLLSQAKVIQLLRHVSKCRRLEISSMPDVLCKLLRESTVAFQLTEPPGSQTETGAIQDVKVSLTESGETTPLVDKKNFDTLWSNLFPSGGTSQAQKASGAAADVTPAKAGAAATAGTSGAALRGPHKNHHGHHGQQNHQSSESARNLSKQRALQQLSDLDHKGVGSTPREPVRNPADGPRPPSQPPPGYKADWRNSAPMMKGVLAQRVLAPRRTGYVSSLEEGASGTPNTPHTETTRPIPTPPSIPPPASPGQRPPHGIVPTQPAGPVGPVPPAVPPTHHNGSVPPNFAATPPAPVPTPRIPEPVDNEGRPFDLHRVVVNFANVGATYGVRVLKREKAHSYLFDYEGVRRCVRHLTQKRRLHVIGVIFENFHGAENGREVSDVPPDIVAMCESIELTPRLLGQRHKSADDEMTIKCAYRRNCRFLDNDNYQDWRNHLADDAVRTWLLHCQEFLQMKFYFDSGLGDFDTLEGNIPAAWLAQGPSKRMCVRPWK